MNQPAYLKKFFSYIFKVNLAVKITLGFYFFCSFYQNNFIYFINYKLVNTFKNSY